MKRQENLLGEYVKSRYLQAIVLLCLLWPLFAARDIWAQEQPPVPPGMPLVPIKYQFENGKKWRRPTVGYCCQYKHDSQGKVVREQGEVREWLRVFGAEGDKVTVFQIASDGKFFLCGVSILTRQGTMEYWLIKGTPGGRRYQ